MLYEQSLCFYLSLIQPLGARSARIIDKVAFYGFANKSAHYAHHTRAQYKQIRECVNVSKIFC